MSISCLKCGYSITEPLCASCIINEIKIWFHGRQINKEVIRKINRLLESSSKKIKSLEYVLFPSSNVWEESTLKCIKCEKEMHLMCFYCVTNQATQIVKENLEDKDSIELFQESFNTNFYDYELGR